MIIKKKTEHDVQNLEVTYKKVRRFIFDVSYKGQVPITLCATLTYMSKSMICEGKEHDDSNAFNTLVTFKIGSVGIDVSELTETETSQKLKEQIESWFVGRFGKNLMEEENSVFSDMWYVIIKYRMIHVLPKTGV